MRRFSIGLVAGFLAFAALLSLAHAQLAVEPVFMPTPNGTPEPYDASGVPSGATHVQVSANGTTAATTSTMPAVAAKTNWVCGIRIDAAATGLTFGTATLAGILGGSMLFDMSVAAAGSSLIEPFTQTFTPCLPASAVNTAISITSPAPGAGGGVTVNIWGILR